MEDSIMPSAQVPPVKTERDPSERTDSQFDQHGTTEETEAFLVGEDCW